MVRAHLALRLLLLSASLILPLSAGMAEDGMAEEVGEDYGGLPPGTGREVTFDTCNACHSTMLVAQQRLTRDSWDETLEYMVEEHGMDALAPEDRREILDYLSTNLAADTPR
ncbi:MAG: aldehyde dehydrogenase [Proteobacteria bacterium]|nr:aldehyde dehydrogenase [Pseudomonadota bacterium]MDA1354931.1 aldehyde dehydrogenase [Pseudomonadota bacterium]